MTASTLYEAVEPHALWKELLQATVNDIASPEDHSEVIILTCPRFLHLMHLQAIRMVRYILATFHTHDEEIEAVHLPICFCAILETLTVRSRTFTTRLRRSVPL